jgi:hypothetical protein
VSLDTRALFLDTPLTGSWVSYLVICFTCVGCSAAGTPLPDESDVGRDAPVGQSNTEDTGRLSDIDTGSQGGRIDTGSPGTRIDTGVERRDASWEDSTTDAEEDAGCIPKATGTYVDLEDGTFLDEKTCLIWTKDTVPNPGGHWIGREHVAACSETERPEKKRIAGLQTTLIADGVEPPDLGGVGGETHVQIAILEAALKGAGINPGSPAAPTEPSDS